MKKIFFAVLVSFFSLISAANAQCARPGADGCWDLVVLNTKYEATLMGGLDKTAASAEERQKRINELGPRLFAAFQEGKVQAAKARSFLVVVWTLGKTTPVSYKINGRKSEGGTVSQGRFEDVTGKVDFPKMDKTEKLGKPSKIYRVHAEGKSPIGASLQFPWSAIEKATILIRAEDDNAVYPHDDKEVNEGLWIMPAQLALLKQNNVKGSIAPFISQD